MAERVTLQDIADACMVSRNTVSKAINNTGNISPETKERILKKAVELGYKKFAYLQLSEVKEEPVPKTPDKTIALFSSIFLGNAHFSFSMIATLQEELVKYGYYLTLHHVGEEDIKNRALPVSFVKEKTAAIICFEIFEYRYAKMVTEQNLPTLFVDYPVDIMSGHLRADRLLMENRSSIHQFVQKMVKRGKTRFGYVGDQFHCMSFYERYQGMKEALDIVGLPYEEKYSVLRIKKDVLYPFPEAHKKQIENRILEMEELPEVLICANDFVAMDVYLALQKRGVRIPEDIYICGFDDSYESKVVTPPLTTIHIHGENMGYSAVGLLISRIENPDMEYRTVYTESTLILRESTGD